MATSIGVDATIRPVTADWLLHGDPAIVWQVQRDLLGRAPSTWQRSRRRVAREGWGARLIAHRAPDGTWGGGLYTPKWTSTFYTLRLLTQLGILPTDRAARASCLLLLDQGITDSGAVSLWRSDSTDTCVTAMLLSMACYFGFADDERAGRMTDWLLGEQMPDGGWNCLYRRGASHASFHTSISTLEALAALDQAGVRTRQLREASARGRAFFLDHQLYRSSRTGKIIRPAFSQCSFPTRWYFDVLRGLEYFAEVNAPWSPRLADAVAVLERHMGEDGRWKAQNKHPGKTFFELEPPRTASRMNTLRALRVMRWVAAVRRAT